MSDGKAQAALVGVPSDKIPLIWPDVLPFIERACTRTNGRYEAADILGFLLSGVCQLWVCMDAEIDAVAVTEIVCYPRAKAVRVFLASGRDHRKWIRFEPVIVEWAVAQGCTLIELWGRRGWIRALKHFLTTLVILERRIA